MASTAVSEPAQPHPTLPSAKPRLLHLDILRVLGAIAIVFIHVSDDGVSAMDNLPHARWLFCLAIDCAMRWAVPIFVMVSGFLLLSPSREESPRDFYVKRFRRIGIPVVAWSLFYLAWRQFYGGEHLSAKQMFVQGITGAAQYHLWFVFMLAGLYLATPALRIFVRGAPVSLQRWTSLGFLAIVSADNVLRAGNADPSVVVQWVPFIGWYLAGTAFAGVRVSRPAAWGLLALAAASVAAMTAAAAHVAMASGDTENIDYVIAELSPAALVMGLSVFIAAGSLMTSQSDSKFSRLITTQLAPATLGVYLVHPMVLDLLQQQAGIDWDWHGTLIGVPVRALLTTVISFIAALILMRIPVIKTTVGG